MKKIMICAVTLLPLIILLILSVGGVVVSLTSYIYVDSVEFVEDKIVLQKETEDSVIYQLKVNVFPMRANNKELIYSSDDEDIVSVDANGTLQGKDFGETYVRVTSKENTAKSSLCKVIVTDDKIHTITVANPIDRLLLGEEYTLQALYAPAEALNPNLSWTSDNPDIISVKDGVLTANSTRVGQAVITVRSEANPDAFYQMTVRAAVDVTGLEIDNADPVITGNYIETYPTVRVYPAAADEKISYSSSDEETAVVDENGVIRFFKAGTVTISAKVAGYDYRVNKDYTYTGGYYDKVVFGTTSLTVDYADYNAGGQRRELPLTVSCTPSNAQYPLLEIIPNKEGVVEYDKQSGKFYAVGGGQVKLTAKIKTSNDKFASADCYVTVNRAATDILFKDSEKRYTNYIVTNNRYYQFTTEIVPADCSDKTLKFSSSNAAVTVNDKTGWVTFPDTTPAWTDISVKANNDKLERTVRIIYLGEGVETFRVTESVEKTLFMPVSTSAQIVKFIPYVAGENVSKVEYSFAEQSGLTFDGVAFTASEKGTYVINVRVNDNTFATVTVNVYRKVEAVIPDFTAVWDGDIEESVAPKDKLIYTSASKIDIGYALSPLNASLTEATLSAVGAAHIEGTSLIFDEAGECVLTISADGVVYTVTVRSTCGVPDANTVVLENVTVAKGETLEFGDIVKTVSPARADIANVIFAASNDVISVTGHSITANKGGDAVLTVTYGNVLKTVNIHVEEEPEEIILTDNFLYVDEPFLELTGALYTIAQTTANVKTDVAFALYEGNGCAEIRGNLLVFSQSGLARVKLTAGNGIYSVLTVIYAGDTAVIDGIEGKEYYEVEIGKSFIFRPVSAATAAANAAFEGKDNATITSGCIITVIQAVASATDGANAVVGFDGKEYKFKGIVPASGVTIAFDNEADRDIINDKFVTGLSTLQINGAVINSDATYKGIVFSTDNPDVATISTDGVLTFSAAGTVTVTAECELQKGVLATLTLRSTMGAVEGVRVGSNPTYEFDNDDLQNNVKDWKEEGIISPIPSQSQLTMQNIVLTVRNSTGTLSTDGYKVTLLKGGESIVDVAYVSGGKTIAAGFVQVICNRVTTAMTVNGEIVENGKEFTANSGTILLKTGYLPEDANVYTETSAELLDTTYAELIGGNRLKFSAVNQPVRVKFSFADGRNWTVTFSTSVLSEAIDIDVDTVIMPAGARVSFLSATGEVRGVTGRDIDLQPDGANYISNTAGKGTLIFNMADGSTIEKPVVVTDAVNAITGVTINDLNKDGTTAVISDVAESYVHKTLSRIIEVSADLPIGIDRLGNVPQLRYRVVGDAANIDENGTLTFTKAGEVSVFAYVESSDYYYAEYTVSAHFKVISSYGCVEDYSFTHESGIIVDDALTDFNLYDCVSVLAPIYGRVEVTSSNFSFSSDNPSAIEVIDGVAYVRGTGNATITAVTKNSINNDVERRVTITVDKYADGVKFTSDKGYILTDATKTDTYKLSLAFLSDMAQNGLYPTLTGVEYSVVSGSGAEVDANGIVRFTSENVRCTVRATVKAHAADKTAPYAEITLVRVPVSTGIITVDDDISRVVIEKDKHYVLNLQFDDLRSVDFATHAEFLTVVNAVTQTFSGLKGGELSMSAGAHEFTVVITENVERIDFSSSAPQDGALTALGAADHGINLAELFGATVYPSTARNADGRYQLSYEVVEGDAQISDGILTFNSAGGAKIAFTAGGVRVVREIVSTLGYAQNVIWNDDFDFLFADGGYTISADNYEVYPANAYLHDINFESLDSAIFTVENNVITFIGGGETKLRLNYLTAAGTTAYTDATVSIFNPVTKVSVMNGLVEVGYLLSDKNFAIDTTVVTNAGARASDYTLIYTSSDESLALVGADGFVTFLEGSEGKQLYVTVSVKYAKYAEQGASATVAVKSTALPIVTVTDGAENKATIENNGSAILYPIPDEPENAYSYELIDGADVVDIDGDIIRAKKGGYATIKVTAGNAGGSAAEAIAASNGVWTKNVVIFVHERVNGLSFDDAIISGMLSSKKEFALKPVISPESARHDGLNGTKFINYDYDNTLAAIDANGNVTFLAAGTLTITVKVWHNGIVEYSENVIIESTFGEVRDFSVNKDGATAADSYVMEDVGGQLSFTVDGVLPDDFDGAFIATVTNSAALSVAVSGNTVTVTGVGKGAGALQITYGSLIRTVNIDVKLKSTGVEVYLNGGAVSSVNTLENVVNLTAQVLPIDASNKNLVWQISGGATVDNGVITLPAGGYGTYTLTVSAADGGGSKSVTVKYLQDIASFGVKYGGAVLNNEDTLRLEWNEARVVLALTIMPENLVGNFDYSQITAQSANGSTITGDGKYLTIATASIDASPAFTDTITLKYKTKYTFVVKLSRFGVKSVDFIDHDNVADTQYGLQQMRVFGKQSYYDGGNKNYYKLPVEVTPASLGENLRWTAIGPDGTPRDVSISFANGTAFIDFSRITGNSTDDIENNIFDKNVTISATDDVGRVLRSYTFHVINNGVNVFDEAGYVANGSVILHTNLGGPDESTMKKYVPLTATSGIGKSFIYGNGFIVNLYAANDTYTERTYGYSFGSLYNVHFKGAKFDATKKSYFAAVGFSRAYYSKLSQVWQMAPGNGSYTKNCKLIYIRGQGAQIAVDEKKAYYENIVGFDAGFVTFDSQVGSYYFKGFIDVYNFRNKDTLKDIAGGLSGITDSFINQVKKDNARYVYTANNVDYVNAVVFCKKDGDTMPVYFYNVNSTATNEADKYEAMELGPVGAAKDLKRAVIKILGIPAYSLWSYPANEDGYPKYTDEYNSDGSVNTTFLGDTDKKLQRIQG